MHTNVTPERFYLTQLTEWDILHYALLSYRMKLTYFSQTIFIELSLCPPVSCTINLFFPLLLLVKSFHKKNICLALHFYLLRTTHDSARCHIFE